MDQGDPISILFTKIRSVEPDLASKIIGYLLLQDLGNRDLMRLALGPDTLLHSVCLKAKSALGLGSISRPINIHPDGGSDFPDEHQLLSFLDSDADANAHKRSFSASDAYPQGDSPPDYVSRLKMAQRQRLAPAHYLAAASPRSYDNFLFHHPNALRSGHEREEFMASSASKQIYLTFPADSSFTDEHVSNYFGTFGPVQDVRIPYQQKRMFGFVTFLHSETVRIILARGNPHFICDSRVLVKPYKEKGRILEKTQQQQMLQQMERGNYSPGSSPSGMDSRDLFDSHLGPRMFSNTQEMLRRKAEQADLQQAIEFQRTRFLNLQLPGMKTESFHHHQRSLSIGSPVRLPSRVNQGMLFRSENAGEEVVQAGNGGDYEHFESEANLDFLSDTDHNSSQERAFSNPFNKGHENGLPDGFFASPSKNDETQRPNSEKENCATLSVTAEDKPASTLQSA